MHKTWRVAAGVVLLLISVPADSALAWEFSLRTELELRYRYISRTGPNDLFGNAEYAQANNTGVNQNESSIGLAGPNQRYVQAEGYSSKGSDAQYAEQRFWLYPTFKVNRAITVRSALAFQGNLNGSYARQYSPEFQLTRVIEEALPTVYRGGGYVVPSSENWGTNPHYSGWIMIDSRDIAKGVGLASPILLELWCQIDLPWGILIFGRRPAGFGMGWLLHKDDVYARSISFVVPHGPLTFVFSQYLHDTGEDTDPNNELTVFDRYRGFTPGSAHAWPYTVPGSVDKNKVIDWNQAIAIKYTAGNTDIGAMARIMRWDNVHSLSTTANYGGAIQISKPTTSLRDDAWAPSLGRFDIAYAALPSVFLGAYKSFTNVPLYGDLFFLLGAAYFKYTDSRFFVSAEYDFQLVEARRLGGRPISGFPQAWAAEGGVLLGPAKLSLAHFYRSGHDRRGGCFWPSSARGLITPGVYSNDKWELFLTAWGGGTGPIRPYTFLIDLYGGGNNSYNSAGVCTYQDFLAYAARVDYALAANLNVFASIMKAERASNTGTHVGMYDGFYPENRDYGVHPARSTFVSVRNVPDTDLGFEIDVGFDWKLLESLTFKFLLAHWQPGSWFKGAYIDRSRVPPGASYVLQEANLERTIDPIIAVQTNLLVDF